MGKVVTLGEILIRYSTLPGCRLDDINQLVGHYGGSEANVSVGLSGLSHDVTLLSVVPENPLGRGALTNLSKYRVNTSNVYYSGSRMGTYYVEVGAGPRATAVTYDRKYSSFSELESNCWKKEDIFKDVSIFHVSGITPALSPYLVDITLELMCLAKEQGVKVSFDSNYRSKLWSLEEAKETYQKILPYVDYFSAGKLDAINLLGIKEKHHLIGSKEELIYYYKEIQKNYPNISICYSTIREVITTNENYLTGSLWSNGQLYCSKRYHIPYIIDRIGGGDSFAAGVIHGLLTEENPQHTIEFATGMSVLKHTYTGDGMMIESGEVEQFISSESSKINR